VRVNLQKLDETMLAIAEGRRGLGPIKTCRMCHRRHPARMPCDEGRDYEREQLERERPQ
jgi:hypothetical protein